MTDDTRDALDAVTVEQVARTLCAEWGGSFCLNVGGSMGCESGRGKLPDASLCKASCDQLILSGNMQTARAVLRALPARIAELEAETPAIVALLDQIIETHRLASTQPPYSEAGFRGLLDPNGSASTLSTFRASVLNGDHRRLPPA